MFRHNDINNRITQNKVIATGENIGIRLNDKFDINYNLVLLGDVNKDSKISSLDYITIKNHIMRKNMITDNLSIYAADIKEDSKISSLDYITIKNKIMGR